MGEDPGRRAGRVVLVPGLKGVDLGPKKTATYVGLVIAISALTGWSYGAIVG